MKRLTENIHIKLLSLGLAFILWIFITNSINPMVSGFVNVPVTIENEDYILEQNKTYTVIDSRIIKVTYKVQSNAQTNVRQSDFKVFVDLKDLETTNSLPIHVTPLNDVDTFISNILPEPQVLHVELDNVARSEFAVQYNIRGDVGAGHSVGNVILSPSVVYVSGSKAAVDSIDRISIEIPLSDREETFSGVAKVRLFDGNGVPIPNGGFMLSAEDINYSVVVNSRASINLNAIVEGSVKPGFMYSGVQVSPSSVMISGPKSVVQNMYVQDVKVNIEDLDQNTEYTVKMTDVLPKGITCSVDTVKVNVMVNINPDMAYGHQSDIGESSSNVINMPTTSAEELNDNLEDTEESDSVIETEEIARKELQSTDIIIRATSSEAE